MPLSHNFTASPPNFHGYWSPQSSAVNFCEIDYAITPYIAEFINSLTNLTYVYFAFSTLPTINSATSASSTARSRSISVYNPLSWPATNISLLLVGIGSFAFHATLKHHAQIADEIAMYAIVSTLNYAVYTSGHSTTYNSALNLTLTSPFSRTVFGAALLIGAGTVSYMNLQDTAHEHYGTGFDIHTTLFVVLLTMFWPRMLYLINNAKSPSSSPSTSKSIRSTRSTTFRLSALSFILGFGIWCVDGLYCTELRVIRAQIGLPFAWALEGHGIWHILTAVGAGGFVQLVGEVCSVYGEVEVGGNGNGAREGKAANGSVEGRLEKIDEMRE